MPTKDGRRLQNGARKKSQLPDSSSLPKRTMNSASKINAQTQPHQPQTMPTVSKTNGNMPKTKLKKVSANPASKKSASSPAVTLSKKKSAAVTNQQQQQQLEAVDEEIHLNDNGNAATDGENAVDSSPASNPLSTSYGGLGSMGGMGMGMGGMGMMPGMMGMGGMGMMGMGGGMMGSQWIFSLNQFLFGIQSVVFSLGQAVQIVGMNAQQIRHVYESLKGMVENAMGQVNGWCKISSWEGVGGVLDLKTGDARRWISGDEEEAIRGVEERVEGGGEEEVLTQSEIIRRRRLAAFRWTVTLSISYVLYRTMRRLVRALIFGGGSRESGRGQLQNYGASAYPMQQSRGYDSYGGMGNQYNGRGGYNNGMDRYRGGGAGYGQRQYDPYSQGSGGMGGGYY